MDSWGKGKKKMERQIQGEHLAKAHGVYEGNVQGFHPPNLAHQILWANASTGIIQHQIPERSGYVSDLVATLQWQESRQC